MEKESGWNRFKIDGIPLGFETFQTHPVLLANSAGVFQVACPSEAQRAHLEVPIREHVSQAERVVILFCKTREERVCVCVCGICNGWEDRSAVSLPRATIGWRYAMRRGGEREIYLPENSSRYFSTP